ncbi:MAG TPA: tetraacyldisaccharide 4'-kinase [Terracidiphilus sp.]|jgi:tetraacyldisaccharide 4'-kinase
MKSRPLLWPLVPAYRLALALREFQLRAGLKPVRKLSWPVVSIGNLSAGGAGKTPLTIALAKALTARGLHVDVLSRGYGRGSALPLLVDGSGGVSDFGDEPLEIARAADVAVLVAAERYDAGVWAEADAKAPHDAEESLVSRAHILDDGFQHRQLARDVNILLLSRADLNDHLLPAGNLREPLQAAARAHVIAIPADEPDLEAEIRARGWNAQIWGLHRRMDIPDGLAAAPVAAFCGIARPDQFFAGLESAGLKLAAKAAFADHHNYTEADLDRVTAAARNAGATMLLTTEKDRVRLGALASTLPVLLPIKTVQLRVEIEDEDAAIEWLIGSLGSSHPVSRT